MHRRSSAAARILLISISTAMASACGGRPEPSSGIVIDFSRQELLQEAAQVAIYFYGPGMTCDSIRASQPRPVSVLGPYQAELDDEQRTRGITFRRSDIPIGEYTVFVDALDLNGRMVGSGCAPNQQVFDRAISGIRITIS